MNDYSVLKLSNGEDLVCRVIDKTDSDIIIESPLKMETMNRMTHNGLTESLSLTRWLQPFSDVKSYTIQKNSVEIAKENSSITQLEKFNSTLQTEIEHLETGHIEKADYRDLEKLKEELQVFADRKSKLREDKTYAEASKNMLQDTGIKTKIIKQYLPIMNKLINTYLTSMEFYVNFTLDENFDETIKSRYRDDFTYASFSEGEKMRIDLALLFTWRAVAR